MKIELRTNGVNDWYVLCARNGRVLMTSETYDGRGNARRAATATATKLGLKLKLVKTS